jgi:hypothetical protein
LFKAPYSSEFLGNPEPHLGTTDSTTGRVTYPSHPTPRIRLGCFQVFCVSISNRNLESNGDGGVYRDSYGSIPPWNNSALTIFIWSRILSNSTRCRERKFSEQICTLIMHNSSQSFQGCLSRHVDLQLAGLLPLADHHFNAPN